MSPRDGKNVQETRNEHICHRLTRRRDHRQRVKLYPAKTDAGNRRLWLKESNEIRDIVSYAGQAHLWVRCGMTIRPDTCAAANAAPTGVSAGFNAYTAETKTTILSASYNWKASPIIHVQRFATNATVISRSSLHLPQRQLSCLYSKTSQPFIWIT